MSVRTAAAGRAAQLKAMQPLLAGGQVVLMSGIPPIDVDETIPPERALALAAIRPADVQASGDGVTVGPLSCAMQRDGRLTWFRVLSGAGAVLLDGTVGVATRRPDGRVTGQGDLLLRRVDLLEGDLIVSLELVLTGAQG